MLSPEFVLRAQGLEPLVWEDVLKRIERRLAANEQATFARLHRAFTAYPADHTCRAFYDFVAEKNLLDLLACQRFNRLTEIMERIDHDLTVLQMPEKPRVLDYGAGGGFLAQWLRDTRSATVSTFDLSPATMHRLSLQGFSAPAADEQFDLILCADSLGEIHADEDDWLSAPENLGDDDYAGELEARYGFIHKLTLIKPRLKAGGSILIYEPVPLEHFWHGAARLLVNAGWHATIVGSAPTWGLRLTHT